MPGIVDAHHHLWRQNDLPWLTGPMVPRIFGPYESIRRDYPAEEFVAEATEAGVTASVYVQTNWPLDRCVDEVRWVRSVHEETGWPTAVVGCVDLFSATADSVLAEQARTTSLLRGVRLQLHHHPRPEFRFAADPEAMDDVVFRRNLARLADHDWLFELQVFPGQVDAAERLVRDFPDITFVLVHAGMLVDRDARTVTEWRDALTRLAAHPNVVAKLSGQGTFCHRVDPTMIRLVLSECLRRFGSHRCLWGSNFPVEKIWTSYAALLDAWTDALAAHPEKVREDVLSTTARRVYRLDAPNP
ncbi:amidohydrolase family protein [Spiractinospora alimapuensis]|uniref:amidohydrolase family protein n=1 Tax=Spiractinospora alimapuensis TaxID=2820884 RepID=UPI001F1ADCA1|nr:amidohydrolase family protein [Spiractinospora alimapuensis]QVQ53326.1 amidohydrolase family protein [Spiractinospora alimapuensis]